MKTKPKNQKKAPPKKATRSAARKTKASPASRKTKKKPQRSPIQSRVDVVMERLLDRFVAALRRRVDKSAVRIRELVEEKDVQLFLGATVGDKALATKAAVVDWMVGEFVTRYGFNTTTLVDKS